MTNFMWRLLSDQQQIFAVIAESDGLAHHRAF